MRGDKHGAAVGDLVVDEIQDDLSRRDVEAGDRFVEEQYVAFLSEALGN